MNYTTIKTTISEAKEQISYLKLIFNEDFMQL
ncbi:hypothetical protein SAMN06265376_102356 [Dokdonia pacifica]|uniref:Uncharacterized protein n=1 Tax=Dokdonia pacifica TaxID=1627892 RepID=A0A238YTL0_9FLAO|nr:hypothetical protein SAMN06265376_102356 [Dokdonia pacifica]